MTASFEDITRHPCWLSNLSPARISHRSGGFGGTCERCGTSLIEGNVNNGTEGPLKWEPVSEPLPFQPGSVERLIYTTIRDTGVPIHNEWKRVLATEIASRLKKQTDA